VHKPALFENVHVRVVAIAAVVATGMLVPVQQAQAAPAPAFPAPPVINMSQVPAQFASAVQAFETNAVSEVLTDHDLPSSDANAVLAWGRDDVRAQEWEDLDSIISEPQSSRSADDQLVYEWFTGVEQQQQILAAQDAISEYFKWSGLTSLTTTTPPRNYGPNGTGFCDYQPPGGSNGPFAGSYTGGQNQVCFQPCTDFVTDCSPDYPTVAEFEEWGDYDATQHESSDPNYYTTMVATSVSMGIGLTAALGSVALPFGTAIDASALSGSAIEEAVFPFAARVGVWVAQAARLGTNAADLAAQIAPEAAAGAEAAGAIAFVAGIVIFAIISIVLASIQLATDASLPSDLETALTTAQTTTPDLTSMNTSASDGYQALYALFVSTTLPEADLSCDGPNTVDAYGTDLCANAPTPPAPSSSDPVFKISENGTTSLSRTLYSIDPAGYYDNTYMSGNGWFVTQRFDPTNPANATTPTDGSATLQSLSFDYTDWAGNNYEAERVMVNGQPMFAITPLDQGNSSACAVPAGTASTPCLTTSIQYQAPNGTGVGLYTDATAQLVPASSAAPTAYATYANTVDAGQATTFTATGSDPNNSPLTYHWLMPPQWVNGGITCPNGVCEIPLTGQSVQYTFTVPGIYQASLTVTNSADLSSTENFTVSVTDRTTINLTSSADPSVYGQPVTVTADVQAKDVGAGVPNAGYPPVGGVVQFEVDGKAYGPPEPLQNNTLTCVCSDGTATITLPALTTTPPAGPGGLDGHDVTVDYLGATDYLPTVEKLGLNGQVVNEASTAVTMTESPAAPVVGQPVTITAQVSPVAPGQGVPTGTVDFYYLDLLNSLGSAKLNSSGIATFTFTPEHAAPADLFGPSLQATYFSDGNFAGSFDQSNYSAAPDATTTTVTSSANPSSYRQPVTFTATVLANSPGGGTPTGDVQFTIDGTPAGSPVALNASGQATFTTDASDVLAKTGSGTSFPNGHVVSAEYAGTGDYLTSTSGTLSQSVNAARLTITASSPTVTYGAPVPVINAVYSGFVAGDTAASLTTAPTCSTTYRPGNGAGSADATDCQGAVDPNYVLSYVSGAVRVQAATLTITAKNASMVAGGKVPALGFTATGFVLNEGLSALAIRPACTATNPATGKPVSSATKAGTYPITCRGGVAKNYAFHYVAGTLTISAHRTGLVYSGGQTVVDGTSFSAAAAVSTPSSACAAGQQFSFLLNRNPATGAAGGYLIGVGSTSHRSASALVSTSGWQPGVYVVTAQSAVSVTCSGASASATLTVGSAGTKATGSGTYTAPGKRRVTFSLSVQRRSGRYTGSVTLTTAKWKLAGTVSSYVVAGTAGSASGTGRLYRWNQGLTHGHGGWQLAASGVKFTASFTAAAKGKRGTFGVNIAYQPAASLPALPNSGPEALATGHIALS
jgi:hypothetical protein